MTKAEYILFKKLIEDNKKIREDMDYLIEATNFILKILTKNATIDENDVR